MSRKQLKAGDSEGFLRAFTDEWAELQLEHKVELAFSLAPTTRKGVLALTVRAVGPLNGSEAILRAKYTCEYPTAAVGTFEACLYQSMIRTGRILREQEKWPMGRA